MLRLNSPHARTSEAYSKIMQAGDEEDYDAEGRHLSQTPVAIVESLHDTNPAYVAYALRHWNSVPPITPAAEPEKDVSIDERNIFAAASQRSASTARFVSARTAKTLR